MGYIVARAGEVEIGDLRAYLERRLPAYMVPAALVVLERLPLSLNGKLERTALPAPDWEKLGHAHRYVEPQTPVEELLAKVWAQVLGLEQVGIHDNFFELGGHSLLATQMISRVRDTFRMQVPLQALFAAPTVAGLAEALVKHEVVAGQVAAIARLRKKIDALSPEERQQALQNKEKERKS